jgi:CRP/FNR family cyclic AMP-dependent transcriptional regulator
MPRIQTESDLVLTRSVLENESVMGGLTPDTREAFLAGGRVRRYVKDDVLSSRGEPVDSLIILIDGVIEISRVGVNGRRHILFYLERGQVTNLVPMLDRRRAIHDAIAHTDCLVLHVGEQDLTKRMACDPQLTRGVIAVLCLRTRTTYAMFSNDRLLPLRQRCAWALFEMVRQHGRVREENVLLTLKLSREEFAEMLGRTRQAIGKELQRLEEEGVIRTTYSTFVINDRDALERIARVG